MSWEGFMEMERKRLWERREGKLRRALRVALPSESVEQLDRIGEHDRRMAEQGLVPIKEGSRISYKHIGDLSPLDMRFVTAAERAERRRLQERLEEAARPWWRRMFGD